MGWVHTISSGFRSIQQIHGASDIIIQQGSGGGSPGIISRQRLTSIEPDERSRSQNHLQPEYLQLAEIGVRS